MNKRQRKKRDKKRGQAWWNTMEPIVHEMFGAALPRVYAVDDPYWWDGKTIRIKGTVVV